MNVSLRLLCPLFVILGSNYCVSATITSNFQITVANGALAGQTGAGWFSYDDAALSWDPELNFFTPIGVNEGLIVSFEFDGLTYTHSSDVYAPDYPTLNFESGTDIPTYLNFWLVDNQSGVAFNNPLLKELIFLPMAPIEEGVYDYEIELHAVYVPVPAAGWLFACGLAALLTPRMKR